MGDSYTCAVCGYPDLTEPPRLAGGGGSYVICRSCGFEYGVTDDDLGFTYEAWREQWIGLGMPWWAGGIRESPPGWDPGQQLANLLRGEKPSAADDA